jgi:hypothetical protein
VQRHGARAVRVAQARAQLLHLVRFEVEQQHRYWPRDVVIDALCGVDRGLAFALPHERAVRLVLQQVQLLGAFCADVHARLHEALHALASALRAVPVKVLHELLLLAVCVRRCGSGDARPARRWLRTLLRRRDVERLGVIACTHMHEPSAVLTMLACAHM